MSVEKETVCFVFNGGAGATVNAGGATKAAWDAQNHDASKFMQADGSPIARVGAGTSDACWVYEKDGDPYDGKVRIDSPSAAFGDVVAGSVAYIDFVSVYDSGYYEVVPYGATTLIVVDLEYTTNTQCDIWVGGAFPGMQAASETDLMNAESYTRTCLVRGNANLVGNANDAGMTITCSGSETTRARFIACNSDWEYEAGSVRLRAETVLSNGVVYLGTGAVAQYQYWQGFDIDAFNLAAGGIRAPSDNAGTGSVFVDCDFHNARGISPTTGTGYYTHSNNVTFINCKFYDNTSYGFRTTSNRGTAISFFRCSFYGNNVGIWITYSYWNVIDCAFFNNASFGVQLNRYGRYAVLDGNTFYNNGSGLYITETPGLSIRSITGNVFAGNSNYGAYFNGVVPWTADYNLFFDNGTNTDLVPDAQINSGVIGTNNLIVDPKFVDHENGNFDYQHDSPCLGALPGGGNIGSGGHLPDYPAITDVLLGVEYSHGELTGTAAGGGSGGGVSASRIFGGL